VLGVRRELRAPVTRAHRSRTLVQAPLLILFPVLRSIQVTLSLAPLTTVASLGLNS
jgi:hypothetical protein